MTVSNIWKPFDIENPPPKGTIIAHEDYYHSRIPHHAWFNEGVKVLFDNLKEEHGVLVLSYEVIDSKEKRLGSIEILKDYNPFLLLSKIQEYNPDNEPEDDCL